MLCCNLAVFANGHPGCMHPEKTYLDIIFSQCIVIKLEMKLHVLSFPFKRPSYMHVASATPNEPPHDHILQPFADGQTLDVAATCSCKPLHYVHA